MLNRADRITDLVKGRLKGIIGEVVRQHKGTYPYRKVPATDKQILEVFYKRPPDWENQLLNKGVSPQEIEQYNTKIDEVMRRQSNGG